MSTKRRGISDLKCGTCGRFKSKCECEQVATDPEPSSTPTTRLSEKMAQAKRGTPPHLMIVARAGTGKTTTLVEGLKVLKGLEPSITPSPQQQTIWDQLLLSKDARTVCFVAFNKSIATELKKRVPTGCDASTMHGMGFKAVSRAFKLTSGHEVEGYRVQDIIEEITKEDIRDLRKNRPTLLQATSRLVELCKMNLVDGNDTEGIDRLASHYDVDMGEYDEIRDEVYDLIPQVLTRCKDVRKDGCVDFNDMIWLPVVLNLPLFRYDLLLVDEAQDLNRCQQEMVKRAGQRIIFCGDPRQAIYGFAGADSVSMSRLHKDLNGLELPLNVTRRCGKAIVAEVKSIVPDFEAFEANGPGLISEAKFTSAKEGYGEDSKTVQVPYDDSYLTKVKDGDFILCWQNAPLVSQCFKLIRHERKAIVRGRDIGQGLITLITKLKAETIADLIERLEHWKEQELLKEKARKNPIESKIMAIHDRVECIRILSSELNKVADVIKKIDSIFSDSDDRTGIILSSIHKAKGLEAKRVFFLQHQGSVLPHPKAEGRYREEQINLKYVAITRAIEELIYVR